MLTEPGEQASLLGRALKRAPQRPDTPAIRVMPPGIDMVEDVGMPAGSAVNPQRVSNNIELTPVMRYVALPDA